MKRICVLFLLMCFCLTVYSQQKALKFDKDTISFLPCQQGEELNSLFTFTNKSKDSISIMKIVGSYKYLTSEYKEGKIPPGGCGYVLLHYNSKADFGPFLKQLMLITSNGIFNVSIRGEIVSRERPLTNLEFSKKVYNAGIIKGSASKDYVLKFNNPTAVPVYIKGIGVKGTPFDVEYDTRIECAGKVKKYYKRIIGIGESGEILVHLKNKRGKLHGPQTTKLLIWANLFDGPLVITVKSDFE